MAIPPPPPGFSIVSGGAPQRQIIRRGLDPQNKIVQDGQIIDPNTGTAAPIANYQHSSKSPIERQTDEINLQLKRAELAEKQKKAQSGKAEVGAAANDLRNVIDNAFRARELSKKGWFSTGLGAGVASKIGGTSASDVKGLLDTIGANTAFAQLQKMREASPTGAALGSITERELALLQSTIASLDQAQSDEQFQGAMQQIAESYGRVLSKLPGGRAMMIERGWLPKSGAGKKQQPRQRNRPQSKPRVVDWNELPE